MMTPTGVGKSQNRDSRHRAKTHRNVLIRAETCAMIDMNSPVASTAGKSGQPLKEGCSRASLFAFPAHHSARAAR